VQLHRDNKFGIQDDDDDDDDDLEVSQIHMKI